MTNHRDISRNSMPESASLREVMERLNQGVGGIVLLTDGDGVLTGVATDGDLRRAILEGLSLDAPISGAMQRSFASGNTSDDRTKNLARLSATVRHLPLLDDNGRPVDMLAWTDLWRMPLVQPSLAGNESKYVNDCLITGWVSSQGSYISRFEQAFQEYMGSGSAMCTSSGTTALHLALLGLEIGPGDEVIVPDLTFGATANAVVHAGAKPVFVDIDAENWTIDPGQIAEAVTERTKAVIPVHLYGHPCDMDALLKVSRENDLKVIEDCAESLGAEYNGQKAGTFGDVACFSFFANKVITTGEGGMVWTRNKSTVDRMAVYRDHGMSKDRRYWHEVSGYNYRMTNMQAAVGLAQLEQIEHFLSRRDALAARYSERLSAVGGIHTPARQPWARSICWLYTVAVDELVLGMDAKTLIDRLAERGIETRHVFSPLHDQPAFRHYRSLETAHSEHVATTGVSLPTSNEMTVEDVDVVCDAILSVAGTSQALRASEP